MASIFRRIFNRFRNPFRIEIKNFLLWKDALPDALIVVDEVGKIVEVNVQAERMFGYTGRKCLDKVLKCLSLNDIGICTWKNAFIMHFHLK